jgi:hypothetical protein
MKSYLLNSIIPLVSGIGMDCMLAKQSGLEMNLVPSINDPKQKTDRILLTCSIFQAEIRIVQYVNLPSNS